MRQPQRDAGHIGHHAEAGTRLHDELLPLLRGLRNPVLFLTGHGDIPMVVDAIEVHRARVFAKLGVRSAAEVATLLARG